MNEPSKPTPLVEQIARGAAEKIGEATGCSTVEWEESITPFIQAAIEKATEDAYDAGYMAACREAVAPKSAQPQPRKATDDCVFCGRGPHPDSCGHSYLPRGKRSETFVLVPVQASPNDLRAYELNSEDPCGYMTPASGAASSEPRKEEPATAGKLREPQEWQSYDAICYNCGVIQHDQFDAICTTCQRRALEAIPKKLRIAHNAALAAERELREQAERWLEEKRDESAMFATDATKYHAQLLQVKAANLRLVEALARLMNDGLTIKAIKQAEAALASVKEQP